MNVIYYATGRLLLNGQSYSTRDPVSLDGVSRHRLKQLVAARKVTALKPSEEVVEATRDEGATSVFPEPEIASNEPETGPEAIRPRKRRRVGYNG